jgi:hypothetical protein
MSWRAIIRRMSSSLGPPCEAGVGIQPSPSSTARRKARAVWPAMKIGTGACTLCGLTT